jgi:Ca2+-binding RTX toxin-like protein
MRRTVLVLVVMVATLVAASGVALAVYRSGGPGNDLLIGTYRGDTLEGFRGDDTVVGLAGTDEIWGGYGADLIKGGPGSDGYVPGRGLTRAGLYGGPGQDVIRGGDGNDDLYGASGGGVSDGQRDWLYCGNGTDDYDADRFDYVSPSCERKMKWVRVD